MRLQKPTTYTGRVIWLKSINIHIYFKEFNLQYKCGKDQVQLCYKIRSVIKK